jgi:hypothetical protein
MMPPVIILTIYSERDDIGGIAERIEMRSNRLSSILSSPRIVKDIHFRDYNNMETDQIQKKIR